MFHGISKRHGMCAEVSNSSKKSYLLFKTKSLSQLLICAVQDVYFFFLEWQFNSYSTFKVQLCLTFNLFQILTLGKSQLGKSTHKKYLCLAAVHKPSFDFLRKVMTSIHATVMTSMPASAIVSCCFFLHNITSSWALSSPHKKVIVLLMTLFQAPHKYCFCLVS